MPRELPRQISLEQVRLEAKALLRDLERGQPAAVRRARAVVSLPAGLRPKLADAQHVVAREYGFPSWPKLKDHLATRGPGLDPREALVAAVQANDLAAVRDLLDRHPGLAARLNEPMPELPFGSLLLMPAVRWQNRELIDLLLGAGADVNARSHWWAGGFGLLDSCDPALAPFLIERGAVVDAHAAARLGMLERLQELVLARPELVHARGGDGQTPLHFAASPEIAAWLLDHGAEIDARDLDHESTPAQWMVRDRQPVARFLVERGGHSDLLMAAALGDPALTRRHLEADPACVRMSVNARWFPKRDPRSAGTIYSWTLGANRTAHLIARESGHTEVFSLLMEHSPAELQLTLACELGDQLLSDSLLAGLPDLAASLDDDDRRRLADAAQDNNLGAVRLMLAAGWPVDARGQHGATALHWAAFHANAEMVQEILRHQPPLEDTDAEYQQQPLGWALYGSKHGWHPDAGDYAEVVEILLAAGARAPELSDGLEASDEAVEVLRRRAGVG